MSIRRLESTIDQLRSKLMTYVRELSKKSIAMHRLKSLLDTKVSEAGERSSPLSSDTASLGTHSFQDDEDILVDKDTEITKLNMELDQRSRTVDSQRIEIVALKIQVDALKRQIADLPKHPVQARGDLPRRRTILRLAG